MPIPVLWFQRQTGSSSTPLLSSVSLLCPLVLTIAACYLSTPNQSLDPHVSPPLLWRLPLSCARWIWRWLCLARGKIRHSRCPCSGCPWSVSRCCWKRCRVTLTRSRKIPCRLWMSSHDTFLPWGTGALSTHKTHHTVVVVVLHSADGYCFSSFVCNAQFPAVVCLPSNFITQYNSCVWYLPRILQHAQQTL